MRKRLEFNVNTLVRFKLTDRGRKIHREAHDKLYARFPKLQAGYRPPKEDADGWIEWQLWELIAAFGEHTSLGLNPCFETTIEIFTDDLKDVPDASGEDKEI